MLNRIRHMAQKEFIQVFRDKRMRFVLFLVPVIQLVLFGYVVTTDVRHIAMGVYDLDNSPESRALVRAFTASGYFEITHRPASQGEITRLLDEGKVLCVIVINAGFSKALARGLSPKVQILFDATDSNTTTVAIGYAKSIIGNYAGAAAPAIEQITVRPWFNPELKSKNYNVPGVAALIVLVICLMLTSMSVVREREIGTMEQLLVTPLRPIEILLGKTIPFGIIGVANMIISVTVAVVWFDVPIRGSIALLFFCTLIYLLSILG
ncbi:MAG: ABC transporter permease, partial [Nitrospirae bacterium]|nr:ABC transporter permease [Nitrospirota bacterium]